MADTGVLILSVVFQIDRSGLCFESHFAHRINDSTTKPGSSLVYTYRNCAAFRQELQWSSDWLKAELYYFSLNILLNLEQKDS